MVTARKLEAALDQGPREALVYLAKDLAREVGAISDPTDRLPVLRAFLAVLRDLEAVDEARRRDARLTAKQAATAPVEAPPGPLDDLLERRARRGKAG